MRPLLLFTGRKNIDTVHTVKHLFALAMQHLEYKIKNPFLSCHQVEKTPGEKKERPSHMVTDAVGNRSSCVLLKGKSKFAKSFPALLICSSVCEGDTFRADVEK